MRSGSLNIPGGQQRNSAGPQQRFEGPRSPPNTAHVPCKFFRQGACQAGNACPFSHDLNVATETVCKYFSKGNCKFGPKCANIHLLPDGRRINYGKNGLTIGQGNALPGRSNQNPTSPTSSSRQTPSASALTNSLYADPSMGAYPYDDRHNQHNLGHHARQPSLDNGIPIIDAPRGQDGSQYGSPRDDDSRFGLGLSPINGKGLSVLDAPLPASFDSNGISNAARFPAAPWPSSVPSKFGLESPTPSLSNAKDSRTSDTLKALHSSAFGSEHMSTPLAGSPTNSHHGNGLEGEYYGRRTMHSSRFARPKMLSASMPKTTTAVMDNDWEDDFAFDDNSDNVPENYVPENLQDLLTPAEKARRGSIRADDVDVNAIRYGSPIGSSPGRFGSDELSRSARGQASAFGHVGSPLRNSTLAQEMGANGRPSVMRSGSESMSVLSQQLQRSRLDDAPGSSSPLLHPSAARSSAKSGHMERHVSSGSISSSVTGRYTTPIDEENADVMFSMDDDEDPAAKEKAKKRASSGLSTELPNSWANVAGKGSNGANGR